MGRPKQWVATETENAHPSEDDREQATDAMPSHRK